MAINLIPENVHSSWTSFLDEKRQKQLQEIAAALGTNFDPAPEQVLRFMTTDLQKLQVVILGQDPYPQAGIATGRAFEVGGLTSWTDKFPQASLKNIVRLLYSSYQNIREYAAIPKFKEIRRQIEQGEWHILPPHKLFESWEQQGVLLLNTCLTVSGKPGGHAHLCADFSRELIRFISEQRPDLYWFLWGKQAQAMQPYVINGNLHCSRHPMLSSPRYADDFLRSDCFRSTQQLVNWLGV